MAYSMYVARKKDGASEYWAFVIEGNGIHVKNIKKVPVRDNSKLGYIEAYIWASNYVKTMFSYGDIKDDNVVFYFNTDTLRRWVNYFVRISDDYLKPPDDYFDKIEELYNILESVNCRYCIRSAQYNRATMYATRVNYEALAKNNKRETVADAFGDLLKE